MTLQVKKLDPRAVIPSRATPGSAGMDLHALLDRPLTVLPGERVGVPTGIAIGLPSPETVGLVYARSGLATKFGLTLGRPPGGDDHPFGQAVHHRAGGTDRAARHRAGPPPRG